MMVKTPVPPRVRSLAMSLTGEFLLVIGVVFALLGIAHFVTDFIGIEGAGEFMVGVFMVVLAFALLLRSKAIMPAQEIEKKEEPSESYR